MPRDPLLPATQLSQPVQKRREQHAIREALGNIIEGLSTSESGSSLLQSRLEEIYAAEGPKAWMNTVIRLMEYTTPKLQRVVVDGEGGQTGPRVPTININFGPNSPVKVVDITPDEAPE